jgi:glycosyltransferase involved in cell wall biosynthesis
MPCLSVTIITLNEEKNIGRCIDSVRKVADEIIVLDSFSTDRTVDIALQKGAIVKQEKFRGFIEQKNRALQLASHPYILSLDADEALDETLADSILKTKQHAFTGAYTMSRCTHFCGKEIRHGLWYPDKKLRLFDKRTAGWGGINPHDCIKLHEAGNIHHLEGDILHFSYTSIEDYLNTDKNFSSISARSLYKLGRKTNLFKIIINPTWAFINGYILRLGFLDGLNGFLIAANSAYCTFTKHIILYNLQNIKKEAPLKRPEVRKSESPQVTKKIKISY